MQGIPRRIIHHSLSVVLYYAPLNDGVARRLHIHFRDYNAHLTPNEHPRPSSSFRANAQAFAWNPRHGANKSILIKAAFVEMGLSA